MKISHNDLVDYVINKELERLNPELANKQKYLEIFEKKNNPLDILLEDAAKKHAKLIKLMKASKLEVVVNYPDDITGSAINGFLGHGGYRTRDYYSGLGFWGERNGERREIERDMLLISNQFIVKYTVPKAILKQVEDIKAERRKLKQDIAALQGRINDVRSSSAIIKSKITEQILQSTTEGEVLKEKLEGITFSKLLGG